MICKCIININDINPPAAKSAASIFFSVFHLPLNFVYDASIYHFINLLNLLLICAFFPFPMKFERLLALRDKRTP